MSNPIYTIGYGSRSLEELLSHLQRWGIELLVDVRSHPYSSHKPAFSRKPLAAALAAAGIDYEHLAALGGRPRDPACFTAGKVDYAKVRTRPFYTDGLRRLQEEAGSRRTAILCAEERPESCHRALLIAPSLVEREVPVLHLDRQGEIETHDQLLRRLAGGQRELFRPFPPPLE